MQQDEIANPQTTEENNTETAALLAIVAALRPLAVDVRSRLVDAALTFLGGGPRSDSTKHQEIRKRLPESEDSESAYELPKRALIWLSQASLSVQELDSIFHRSPLGVEFIAHSVPGKSKKDQVRSCYVLAGVQGLLKSGEARFADDDARAICRDLGCYDKANHATYVKALGNLVIGSKSTSYELTQPGLRAAAEIMKEMQVLVGYSK
jgi:hypothetical protein